MLFPDLARFQLSPPEAKTIRAEFTLGASNVVLHEVTAKARQTIPAICGCYFWTMRRGGNVYKVYIGRTKSFRKRFKDYTNPIQIHSPNDFKLRLFQEFVHAVDAKVEFDVHLMPVGESAYKARETELVRRFQPFMNPLRRPTPDERARIQSEFRRYYLAAFTDRLGNAR